MSVQEFNLNQYEYAVDTATRTLKVIKREQTAQEWARDMYRRYLDNPDVTRADNEDWTYVLDNKGQVGKAHCSAKDDFDPQIGVAIAYARLYNLPIHPDFLPKVALQEALFAIDEVVEGRDESLGRVIDIESEAPFIKYKVRWFDSGKIGFYFAPDLKKVR